MVDQLTAMERVANTPIPVSCKYCDRDIARKLTRLQMAFILNNVLLCIFSLYHSHW